MFRNVRTITIVADLFMSVKYTVYQWFLFSSPRTFIWNVSSKQILAFTTPRYVSAVYAVVLCLSVRLSVCPSVTRRHYAKTATHRITKTIPHCCQRSRRNSNWVTRNRGAK